MQSNLSSNSSIPGYDTNGTQDGELSDTGSFVCSDGEIEVEEVCEPVDGYQAGLYYPICIADVLNGTHRILHKLGWGGFSTVWMAHHLKDQAQENPDSTPKGYVI